MSECVCVCVCVCVCAYAHVCVSVCACIFYDGVNKNNTCANVSSWICQLTSPLWPHNHACSHYHAVIVILGLAENVISLCRCCHGNLGNLGNLGTPSGESYVTLDRRPLE